MSIPRILLVAFCLAAVAGCSQSPVPVSRSYVDDSSNIFKGQKGLTAVTHWRILARDSARRIIDCVQGRTVVDWASQKPKPLCAQGTDGLNQLPLYVEQVDTAMPFARAYHESLVTELVQRGQTVSLNPEGALTVRFRIGFFPRDEKVSLDSFPGTFTWLGAGIWALKDTGALWRLLSIGALTDIHAAANRFGGAQVLVTTSLMNGERFVLRSANAYYVEDADFGHYASMAPAAEILAPRKAGAKPPAVRSFIVTGQ